MYFGTLRFVTLDWLIANRPNSLTSLANELAQGIFAYTKTIREHAVPLGCPLLQSEKDSALTVGEQEAND
jgi:hypothetical protein